MKNGGPIREDFDIFVGKEGPLNHGLWKMCMSQAQPGHHWSYFAGSAPSQTTSIKCSVNIVDNY